MVINGNIVHSKRRPSPFSKWVKQASLITLSKFPRSDSEKLDEYEPSYLIIAMGCHYWTRHDDFLVFSPARPYGEQAE